LPQIGLTIAFAWTTASLVAEGFVHRWACGVVAAAVLASLMVCAWLQTSHWRNSETLWRHTLEQNDRNVFAHNNLGMALARRGQFDAAVEQYQAALAIRPDPLVYNNFGVALAKQRRLDEAAVEFRAALKLNPHYDTAHNNLANVLFLQNQLDAAADEYREAIRWNPDCAGAREGLGEIRKRQGGTADAVHIKPSREANK
jgi:Flp pilus assembly protein TadD